MAADNVRLIYVSRATPLLTYDALEKILQVAQRENAKASITGVLLKHGDMFLQALEGERESVMSLYHRIEQDPRHSACVLLAVQEITQREFPQWSMRLLPASSESALRLRRFFASVADEDASTTAMSLLKEFADQAVA